MEGKKKVSEKFEPSKIDSITEINFGKSFQHPAQTFSEGFSTLQKSSMMKNSSNFLKTFNNRKYEPFNITNIKPSKELKSNKKYMNLYKQIETYNKKLVEQSEQFVVNYKLYEFLFTSLQVCCCNTEAESQIYLQKLEKWFGEKQKKRQFFTCQPKNNHHNANQDEIIRQNFKSYLPLEIDEYQRKLFLPPSSVHRQKNKFFKKMMGRKKNRTSNAFYGKKQEEFKDEDLLVKNLQQDEKQNEFNRNSSFDSKHILKKDKQNSELPNLRAYKMQILKMRKIVEEREDHKILKQMLKNQSRLNTKTATNFFNSLPNQKDKFFLKTINFQKNKLQNSQNPSEKQIQHHKQSSSTLRQPKHNLFRSHQNQQISLFSQTFESFNQIKKKKLQMMSRNNKLMCNILPSMKEQIKNQNDEEDSRFDLTNIDGLSLIKNPFEIVKIKKGKKK